jgi:hypothetical protein
LPESSKIEKAIILLSLFVIFGLASSQITSGDTFWQLQSGRYMVETRSIIRSELFTLTAEAPHIETSWLHDIILYFCHKIRGFEAISLLKGILILGTALFIIVAARISRASYTSILLVTIPAFLLTDWAWLARPQLWTFILFALFLLVLEKYRQQPDRRIYMLLPLTILWCNLHFGAILAFLVMAAYLVGEGADLLLKRSTLSTNDYKVMLLLLLLMAGSTILTPYGSHILKGVVSIPKLAQYSGKMGPTKFVAVRNLDMMRLTYQQFPVFYQLIGVTILLFLVTWRRVAISHLILLTGLAYMGIKQGRHIPLFLFGVAALGPKYTEFAIQPVLSRLIVRFRSVLHGLSLIIAAGIIFLLSMNAHVNNGFFKTGIREWYFPVKAASFIQEHSLPPNVFNSYEWGGYLEWRLFPDYQVFWDGRDNYKKIMGIGAQITHGEANWQSELERHNVRTLVLMPCDLFEGRRFGIISRLLESPVYALVYAGEFSLVFVRKDSVKPDWLQGNQLPKNRIYETIISACMLLVKEDPSRYMPYFEMFRVYNKMGEHEKSLQALGTYLSLNPEEDPIGERVYRKYYDAMYPHGRPDRSDGK